MARHSSLDTTNSVTDLTRALIDIPSVSGDETALADAMEATLAACAHLEVIRDGDAVVARTALGRAQRVIVAGHIDTVPGEIPVRIEDDRLLVAMADPSNVFAIDDLRAAAGMDIRAVVSTKTDVMAAIDRFSTRAPARRSATTVRSKASATGASNGCRK